ncbi:MAG: hypothetical protein ACI84K_000403 [Pseudohongiellaceae bacterium]|jgi:hypothetical protein
MHPIFLPLVLALFIFSTLSYAEENPENWYQIEYLLFEHINSDRHVLRFEDVKYAPPLREQYYYLTSNKNAASPFQLKEIDKINSDFTDIISRVSKSRELRIYSTGSWQQAIRRGQKLPPLKITGGQSYDNGKRFQLEGKLQIRRERYMHAEINVFLADFTPLPYSDLKNWFFEPDTTKWPINWLLQPFAHQSPILNEVGESLIPKNVIHFEQSRRIKDTEIHYIDHPALGLIITIKEIEPPFEYGAESGTNF